jgi:hypothetical protein
MVWRRRQMRRAMDVTQIDRDPETHAHNHGLNPTDAEPCRSDILFPVFAPSLSLSPAQGSSFCPVEHG